MSAEKWGLGAVLVFVAGAAVANSDLMGLYLEARARDPQFEVARLQRELVQEKLPQARAGWRPVVHLAANTGQQQGQSSFSGAPLEDRSTRTWSWNLQLTQPLWRPAQSAAVAQADALARQADEQLRQAEQELLLRVAQSYLDTVVAQENLRVARTLVTAVLAQLDVAQRNFDVGMTTITDVHESRSRHALARAQWASAQADLDARRADLERLIGRWPGVLARPAPQAGGVSQGADRFAKGTDLRSPTELVEGSASVVDRQHPQTQGLELAVEAAKQEVYKQQGAHGPVLDMTAGYGRNFSSGSMTSPAEVLSRSRATQVGLQFNMPLYAGGLTASRVREAALQQARAEAELALVRGQLQAQEQQALAGWLWSAEQIKALAGAVDASVALVEASQMGYRIGTRINLDVLNAEQQRTAAERDLFKACAEAAMHRLRLKAARGQLEASDLLLVNEMLKVSK